MQYVKTQGIGFGFTDNKLDAMQFESAAQAGDMRDRLMAQFKNYSWEVLHDEPHFYLAVHPQEG